MEPAVGNSRLMTNMTRDENNSVSDAGVEDDCHRQGKAIQTSHRHWLVNKAMSKTAALDITAGQD